MGIALPQVVTSDRASGAQVIDGSLKFDGSKSQYLNRTFSVGNRRTFTWSAWVKRSNKLGVRQHLFGASSDGNNEHYIAFNTDNTLFVSHYESATYAIVKSAALYRDTSSWYHIVWTNDTTQTTDTDRLKIYVNGEEITYGTSLTYPTQDREGRLNNNVEHRICRGSDAYPFPADVLVTNEYFIDGQALDASYFGYTDPLTNTWRPKKYTGSFTLGAASFSLANSDFSANNLRTSSNAVTSGVLTDGVLNYDQTFYGNNGANGSYLDIDMTGAAAGEIFLVRYWNAAEAAGQTITATCKQVDSGGNDIAGTSVAQTWNQGQKWNDNSGYITQIIQNNTSKIRLIFSNNSNNSFGWGIGEVQVEQLRTNQN